MLKNGTDRWPALFHWFLQFSYGNFVNCHPHMTPTTEIIRYRRMIGKRQYYENFGYLLIKWAKRDMTITFELQLAES